jgi:hypothetical protein
MRKFEFFNTIDVERTYNKCGTSEQWIKEGWARSNERARRGLQMLGGRFNVVCRAGRSNGVI